MILVLRMERALEGYVQWKFEKIASILTYHREFANVG